MKMLFKQRILSLLDSYDIYDEYGNVLYQVKGRFAFGHRAVIYNRSGYEVGEVVQRILTFLPKFEIYKAGQYLGCICKELTFLHPRYRFDCNGWQVDGSIMEWDYRILDTSGNVVARISKELFNWSDTYSIDVNDPEDALEVLMFVLAIDAEKCSRNSK